MSTMSSPWGKIAVPEPVNLADIMSEQVARDLQDKEDQKFLNTFATDAVTDNTNEELAIANLDSDEAIALALQKQYDKEYDEKLKRSEEKYNGTSKVSVSFSNYRRAPVAIDFQSDSEEEELEDIADKKDWDRFDYVLREFAAIPPCGYKKVDGSMVTKHDGAMSARKNACKLMSFPPEFETGDGAGFDLQLSNKVFNSLKVHSKHEQARRHRIHDKKEDHATAEFGVDEYTKLLLYKLINKQLLEKVNGVISIGKEAVVLHADCDETYEHLSLPKECVIKVFKTTLSEYKQRDKYIKDDYRFKGRIGKLNTSRKNVQLWAEKEMHNLVRVRNAGIACPDVIELKQHILVMSFIGEDHSPAPKLKNVSLSSAEYIIAYEQVVEYMKLLYSKANLIHADLSEYNILWYKDKCYLIDVSQAVEPEHENAFYFLTRDCANIINFFNRKGVPNIFTADELFVEITGFDYKDKLTLLTIQDSFKMKPHLVDRPGMESQYRFEAAWEKSQDDKKKIINDMDNVNLIDPPLA